MTTRRQLMEAFLSFLQTLTYHSLTYELRHSRPMALMVTVFVPGHRYEVEFFGDGHVEIERFSSSGEIGGEELIPEILSFGESPA
jgi:hypothetical protein